MSILESDWRARRAERADRAGSSVGVEVDEAPDLEPELPDVVAAGPSDRIRKTIGRWR